MKFESRSSRLEPSNGFWGPISILTRCISGDIRLVTVADFNRSKGVSCFTRATVGVIGIVLTGTLFVSAVTVLVSALTFPANRGAEVTQVTVAVHVSVTIFSSDLTLTPTGLPGALGGPLTSPYRSCLPFCQGWMGTWILPLRATILATVASSRITRRLGSTGRITRRFHGGFALHSSLRTKRPILISRQGFRVFFLYDLVSFFL